MRNADANGAEHALSVRSPYANDHNAYANVRSSYANDRHTSAGYRHCIVILMLCVPYQFAHTNQIQENQYHSYDIYALSFNNNKYMPSGYKCFIMKKTCSILLANQYHW